MSDKITSIKTAVYECPGCINHPLRSGTNSPLGYAESMLGVRTHDVQLRGQDEAWNEGWIAGIEYWYSSGDVRDVQNHLLRADRDAAQTYLFTFLAGSFAAENSWGTIMCKEPDAPGHENDM